MLRFYDLSTWRCSADLVRVVDQVGARIAACGLVPFDMATGALLLLHTVLRDERTFLHDCLEEMGVDLRTLARDVQALIEQKATEGRAAGLPVLKPLPAEPFVKAWLERAERESRACGHGYLGVEHVLLAMVVEPDPALAEVLSKHGLRRAELEKAIAAALLRQPPTKLVEILEFFKPSGARWDAPAAGMPRRYSLAMILGMTAVYAVIFAVMRVLGASVGVFVFVTIFFTGVILGQPSLFGGRFPRAASIWIGAVLFPVEVVTWISYSATSNGRVPSLEASLCLSIACIPLGAVLGYLVGGLGAGLFWTMTWYKKKRSAPAAETASFDPFLKEE